MFKNKFITACLGLCIATSTIQSTAYFEQFNLEDIKSDKKLDIDFDSSSVLNKVKNKTYTPNQTTYSYVSSVKGKGLQAKNAKVTIPFSDLGLSGSNKVITVAFIMKWEGNDTSFIPISFSGSGSNNIWVRNGIIGFNTDNSEIYGKTGTLTKNKYYSIVAEFNLGEMWKNKLYIDGVKQDLSYVVGTTSKNVLWDANTSFIIGGYTASNNFNITDNTILDEIKIYSRALSPEEVLDVTNAHKTPELQGSVVNNSYTRLTWNTSKINAENYSITLRDVLNNDMNYNIDAKAVNPVKVRLYRNGNRVYEGYNSSFDDVSATDTVAPNKIKESSIKASMSFVDATTSNRKVKVTFDATTDNSIQYEYKISSVDSNSAESPKSESVYLTVNSGLKGYSYVIDKNPYTIPSNTVNTTSTTIEHTISDTGNYYLHLKAVDNAGNGSEVVHYQLDIPTVRTTPDISKNLTRLDWAMNDVNNKVFKVYQKKSGATSFQAVKTNLTTNYLDDTTGKDTNAPNKPSVNNYTFNNGQITFNMNTTTDIGTTYEYYVESTYANNNSTVVSSIVKDTITTGFKGYSYVVNNSATTEPDNVIDTTSNIITTNVPGGTTYLHIKAIDGAGNASATLHHLVSDTAGPTVSITGNPTTWTNKDITLTVSSSDNFSGVKHIILPDGEIVKNTSAKYVVTINGSYKFQVVDNMGNITTQTVNVTKIDKISPLATITVPNITNDRTITVSLTNIVDTISGVKEIAIAENAALTTNAVKVSLSGVSSSNGSKSTTYKLSNKSTYNEHFSTRNIYIRLYDNTGNYKDYMVKTTLIPKNPSTPVITTPVTNQIHAGTEPVVVKWSYNSVDADLGYLPQQKAEIEARHVSSGRTKVFGVYGEILTKILTELENGEWDIKVRVYNHDTVYTESATKRIRVNQFTSSGSISTVDITPGSPVKHVAILSKTAIPANTSIKGVVYYVTDSKGAFDKSKYVEFTISDTLYSENIITLPKVTSKIKIEYTLKNSSTDKSLTPILSGINIFAK